MVGHEYAARRKRNPKTNNSRKRDKERMTAFIYRKTAEAALAFVDAEDDFILEMQTNTSALDFGTLKRERDELKCINLRLEDELRDSRSQCIVQQASIQESAREINMLKHENQCLHSKLSAENLKLQTVDNTLKEKETELYNIKLDAIQLTRKSKGLQDQIGVFEEMRDRVIYLEKILSSITKDEFIGREWEQLELQILKMAGIMETKDRKLLHNKQTMLYLNNRMRQLECEKTNSNAK
jgi:hypothetical protein